ncbi:MAG: alpha/beta hydrolase [Pseudomonadota bacterium]
MSVPAGVAANASPTQTPAPLLPLVLVHGFLGGGAQWADQQVALGSDRAVVPIDLPGFGARAAALAPESIAGFALDMLDGLTERGITHFDLLGHSMGGMIVQEMIARAPERIGKLILYATSASGAMPDRFETFAVSRARAANDGPAATADRIAATWFRRGSSAPRYAGCAKIARCASLSAINAGLTAMENWSRAEDVAAITAPTLIVWGDQDHSYGWAQIETLWREISGARLAVVPGCAHAVHLEKPALFNAILTDFLREDEQEMHASAE